MSPTCFPSSCSAYTLRRLIRLRVEICLRSITSDGSIPSRAATSFGKNLLTADLLVPDSCAIRSIVIVLKASGLACQRDSLC